MLEALQTQQCGTKAGVRFIAGRLQLHAAAATGLGFRETLERHEGGAEVVVCPGVGRL